MNLLLDTHAFLWFFADDKKLSDKARNAILSSDNTKYVSLASAWELAIKISLGKIEFGGGLSNFFIQVEDNGFEFLPIAPEHITKVESLPFHNRDPFDRLLVATALAENLIIVTADAHIPLYAAPCIW